ncbi:MAG: cell surface protein SprA, partial [Calditrichaceae bacterium]
MNLSLLRAAGLPHLFVLFCVGFLLNPGQGQAQIGIKIPKPPQVISLFEPDILGLEHVAVDSTLSFKKPNVIKRTVKLDSTGKYVSFSEAVDKTDLELPAVVDLETYINMRLDFQARELWKKAILNNFQPQQESEFGAIELDIPFRIKNKTFTRIFGSDRIGLRVTGNISFDLSGRTEQRSGSAVSAVESQNTFSPRFRQQQQFTVEGKIGDKVTVSVEQNSEAVTDIENTLKLRYDGDEDEIVQKIEAGNISLSLPSTKYVIFGGSNQGLFGLKTQMKMGNLHMTAIASLEKGQQQELSISGGAHSSKKIIKDTDFIKNQYFFVSQYYRNYYEKGFRKDDPQTFVYKQGTEIIQLDVFETVTSTAGDKLEGLAVIDPTEYAPDGDYSKVDIDNIPNLDELVNSNKAFKGTFRRLEPEVDYEFDQYRGFLKLNSQINDYNALAIAYYIADPDSPQVGTLYEDLGSENKKVFLKLIKPIAMQPSDKDTWPLMMRNVYSLGGTNIEQEGFDVRLEYNATGTNATRPEGGNNTFLNLLGLDVLTENGELIDGGDEKIDNNPYIVDRSDGTLIFPTPRPFNPPASSRFDLPQDYLVKMYDKTPGIKEFNDEHKFDLVVTSSSTESEFDLGFYVVEGSEVVTLGGVTLERDKDYIIDYFSGKLTLLSNEAKRSSANLEIKYERANLFQLDKKTIFGGRMEYQFWDNSFIGLTALYLSKSTIDERVRVGQEPFQNFVWDLNAAFKFEPRIITRALDWLPMVETNAPSSISVEGEFAQVLPNPNTLNSGSTNDNNGVAYVDDFESSKRTTTLGIRYRTWTAASPPVELPALGNDTPIDSTVNKHRAHIAWFNPYVQTPIQDIWPNRDVNARTGKYTDVLGVDFWREEGSDPDLSWAGMMRSTLSFADQQKTKYIEIWILGDKGTVNVDIGRISEDWYMAGKNLRGAPSYRNLNTEDKNNNGLLEEGEDTGIDGIPNGEPGDTNEDNWSEPVKQDGMYIYDGINGTEGNSNSRDARYPDTEDLDGDGQLSTNNAYYEYSFSLNPDDPNGMEDWIAGEQQTGWRLYRIPIREWSRKVGEPDPDFKQIFNVRLWFSNLPTERTRIRIATFDFVGNEWEENGIASDDTSNFIKDDSLFTVATYNTEENPNIYESPPGVKGVVDRITDTRSKEQSLVLKFVDFQPGQFAEAEKTLYNAMELVNYKRMRMFVHGNENLPEAPPANTAGDSSQIQLYIRFGANDNNYYEYGQDIYAGWNTTNNNIDIDFDELTAIKSWEQYYIGGVDVPVYLRKLDNRPGGYYKAVGNPSLKTVRYFIVGVRHLGKSIRRSSAPFTGEIWLD